MFPTNKSLFLTANKLFWLTKLKTPFTTNQFRSFCSEKFLKPEIKHSFEKNESSEEWSSAKKDEFLELNSPTPKDHLPSYLKNPTTEYHLALKKLISSAYSMTSKELADLKKDELYPFIKVGLL